MSYAVLEELWGREFLIDCIHIARSLWGSEVTPSQILVVAVGKIKRRMECPKCKSIDNVHCVSITEKRG